MNLSPYPQPILPGNTTGNYTVLKDNSSLTTLVVNPNKHMIGYYRTCLSVPYQIYEVAFKDFGQLKESTWYSYLYATFELSNMDSYNSGCIPSEEKDFCLYKTFDDGWHHIYKVENQFVNDFEKLLLD